MPPGPVIGPHSRELPGQTSQRPLELLVRVASKQFDSNLVGCGWALGAAGGAGIGFWIGIPKGAGAERSLCAAIRGGTAHETAHAQSRGRSAYRQTASQTQLRLI